jgi:hypothetical protein
MNTYLGSMGGKGNNIAIILLTRVNVIMRKKLEKSADLPTKKPQCAEVEWLVPGINACTATLMLMGQTTACIF